MRIGFDMLAVQSPHHGPRGIGRYSANLVTTLLARDDGHQYVLYVHDELPTDRIPHADRAEVRLIRPRWELGETMAPRMDRLARTNPDDLDWLVVLSPFETWAHYTPPVRSDNGLKLAAVVYDLIPFLLQNENVVDPVLMRHYRVLETVTRYDALLAISDATRNDCLSVLRLPPDRVVSISGASDSDVFAPPAKAPPPAGAPKVLRELGITKPFLLNVGGLDERKNTWRLIEAFAALPETLRDRHQLVLTFMINHWGRVGVLEHARNHGVEGAVLMTGHVPDETLRLLYQRCAAFAFPSTYEGFGLPILEAMHCGAAVVAGNNSSQVEVVGDAGLLADASDVHDIAAKVGALLGDPGKAAALGRKAIRRAAEFSWDRTAGRALEMLVGTEARPRRTARVRFDLGHSRKPTVAFFSPLPPRKSGVSDYSAFLLDELHKHYRIDLYHDTGYVPEPALASAAYKSCDYRLFDRVSAAKGYHAVVYQMGNSRYHSYMYRLMLRHPGLVTLHDFCLAGFHLHYGQSRGLGATFIRDELVRDHPESRAAIEALFNTWNGLWEDLVRHCAENRWFLNRRILETSQLMVVHSPWCERQVRAMTPELADRVAVIPHGIHPRRTTPAQRAAVRDRFGLPQDALVVASFGFVHPDKMSPQALDAFATVARDDPKALFVFAGEEADGGAVRRHAGSLGLNDRVRFLGRQPAEAFAALITVSDVGVNLRLPPTNGETSGALLNLLAAGVPTVVTDVATFSDYPEGVVRKVKWETAGAPGLLRAIRGLALDPAERQAVGRSAWAYVDEYHEWSRVAALYVDAIERCHAEQSSLARRGHRTSYDATAAARGLSANSAAG